jgi:Ribonuclease G/E|tara:strand:+ start:425 stop:754 length:330 start_codon:yes stop_codon:yes gene_type:complete
MPRKKKVTNENDYEKLKIDYINICKEITSVQNKLNQLDKKREEILSDIRNLQNEKPNDKNKILLNNKNKLILNNSVVIKKPMKSTDMETDDSSSDNLSDYIDISDNDSD